MKHTTRNYLAVSFIVFFGLIFQLKYINEFPSFIHAWAQSDRYALSLGFVDNNLNFFKPKTFVMNHQFPDDWKMPTNTTITAVDFPIHDYIPAVFMKISGVNSVSVFRIYILLYSFIGLFFLFKLSYLQTNEFGKSIFIVLFAATSPVFVYYQSGFLPSIPSLSNAIIAVYFYLKHLKESDKNNFRMSIAFLTLATLSRTTLGIVLFAIFCLEFLKFIRGENKIKHKIIPVALSVVSIGSYYFYNNYLRQIYGSIFLNQFLPATSFKEAKEIIKEVYKNWAFQYFSIFHYLILFLSFITAFLFVFKNKIKITRETGQFCLLILIVFIGYCAFAVIMLKQFPAHDYYFLDTFFLPIVLFFVVVMSFIPKSDVRYFTLYSFIILFLLGIPLIVNAINSQHNRRNTGYWDRTTATINNFKDSDIFLDSLKIKSNAKVLVIDAYAPNIPFILMKRKGYAIISTSKENIQIALKWNYDYIVIQNDFFVSDIYAAYPEIVSRIKKIADNGKISVCTLADDTINQTLIGFLEIENKVPAFQRIITFDTIPDPLWQNTQSTSKAYHSAYNAGYVTQDMTYGLTYKTKQLKLITERNSILLFSAYFQTDTLNDCEIVVSINSKGQNVYYKSYNLKGILKENSAWERSDLLFNIPRIDSDDYEFGIYIYNTGENNLLIDDVTFKIY